MKQNLTRWIAQNKTEFILLLLIIVIAALMRLWRIDEYLPFMGDEGRDVRVVRKLVTEGDLVFIGPRTSIGNMYLGPLYYYLMAPFLTLWNFSPIGPAVFIALLGVVTALMMWFVGREWFGKIAGLAAAFLFSVSPIVILLSRHSWNPNIMPFFALLSIFSIWRVWQKKQWVFLIVLGVSLAFVAQSHYLGLLLLPTVGVFWLFTFLSVGKTKNAKGFIVFSFLSLFVFSLLMLPLLLFDTKHGWQNLGSMKTFFTERQSTVSAKPWSSVPQMWPIWEEKFITRVVAAENQSVGASAALLLLVAVAWTGHMLNKSKDKTGIQAFKLIVVWGLVGIGGLGLYKQSIYDHYFGFLFPMPFLLIGVALQSMWSGRLKWLAIVVIALMSWVNLSANPLKNPPQRQLQRTQNVDRKIIEESAGKPFNFGLIAKRNYEEGYLYFFELWNVPAREIDAQRSEETITDQLFVACEDPVCEPVNNAKAEIASFGWSKIESEWEVGGVKIFKLVHTQNQ